MLRGADGERRAGPGHRLDLSLLITHRIGVDDFQDGFDVMIAGDAGKVVMDW